MRRFPQVLGRWDVGFATFVGFATARWESAKRFRPANVENARASSGSVAGTALASSCETMDGGTSDTQTHLLERCLREVDTLVDVVCTLRNQLLSAGLPDVVIPSQPQRCRLARDPFDGSTTLVGQWQNPKGKVIGSVVVHENGKLFAELDVLQMLPNDASWLVDAVVVFGMAGDLRSELRLTPAIT